jgi:hypothetical protein
MRRLCPDGLATASPKPWLWTDRPVVDKPHRSVSRRFPYSFDLH